MKSEPHRIYLAANRRVWKAIRAGDLDAAERWSAIADRQRKMSSLAGSDIDRHARTRAWIEERRLRMDKLRLWGR